MEIFFEKLECPVVISTHSKVLSGIPWIAIRYFYYIFQPIIFIEQFLRLVFSSGEIMKNREFQ